VLKVAEILCGFPLDKLSWRLS